MDFKIEVRGFDELLKTFSKLPRSVQRKAMRPALRKGANVVKKAASANVESIVSSEATGLLAKSIVVASLKPLRGNLRMAVKIRAKVFNQTKKDGHGNPVRVGLYGSVLEYGKENQPPRSWIRKAAREKPAEVLEAIRLEAAIRIPDAIRDAK